MPRKFQDGGKLSFHDAPVVTVNFMYVIFKPRYMDSVINNLNQTSLTRLHHTHTYKRTHSQSFLVHIPQTLLYLCTHYSIDKILKSFNNERLFL